MKRKFFSLMVAACVALFSVSGLTSCGGGGSDDAEGYLTLDGFSKHGKGVRLDGTGGNELKILPVARDDEKDTSKYGPSRSMRCTLENGAGQIVVQNVLVTYTITAYANAGSINDAQGAVPLYGTMVITMPSADDTTNKDVLGALGLNSIEDAKAALVSAVALNLQFLGNGDIVVSFTVQGTTGAFLTDIEDQLVSVWGTGSVIKSL